jgi:hypothetical protein
LIGWLARRFPRTIGTLIFVVTVALGFVILKNGFRLGQVFTALVICIPLSLAGLSLFARERTEGDGPVGPAPTDRQEPG